MFVAIRLLRPVAVLSNLIDHAGGHKRHDGPVPLVGGLALYLTIGIVLFGYHQVAGIDRSVMAAFLGGGLVVLIGFVDDARDLAPSWRFLAHAAVTSLVALAGGCVLVDFGHLLSDELLLLGYAALPVTVFAWTGGINALNMIDGLDGLAGGLALVTLLSLLVVIAAAGGPSPEIAVAAALIGATAAFLVFNFPWRRNARASVFLGDAGSMFLGFMITWLLIVLSQGPDRAMTPVTALWLYAVPLMDTVRLLLVRMFNGRSPFAPGNDHLHHFLMDMGLSAAATVRLMIALQALLAGIGLIGLYAGVSERFMFLAFMVLSVMYLFVLTDRRRAATLLRLLRNR